MQRMDMILEKCPGTIGLIDDVYGKTKEEHDSNITDLQKVLGIITYLVPFIPHLSDLTAPMTDLLKKESEYQWTASHQKALQK